MHIQPVTAACAATAIAFTSVRFTRTTRSTSHIIDTLIRLITETGKDYCVQAVVLLCGYGCVTHFNVPITDDQCITMMYPGNQT